MTQSAWLLLAAVFLSVAMATAFVVAERSGRSGFIDAIWSLATGCAAAVLAAVPDGGEVLPRQWLASALMAAWTLRLAGHIGARSLRHGDDPRYAHLRAVWGDNARKRLFFFLQIQAACGFILVVAVSFASRNPRPYGVLDAVALAIAVAGLVGATVADRQMERFRAEKHSSPAIMNTGLWSLSRHPNYFFEWLFWCVWPLFALPSSSTVIALSAPALMYWLLRHASGIPHLEAHLERSRPEAFAAYKATVPAFFPWRGYSWWSRKL